MKFSQMKYVRPDLDETKEKLGALITAFEQAGSAKEAIAAYMAVDTFMASVETMGTLAFVRNSLNTTDEFYDAEKAYFDEVQPLLMEVMQRLKLALVGSPYRAAMEDEFGTLMFKNIEIELKTFDPVIVSDMQNENKLSTEYDKLIASAQIEFDGKTLTLAQIRPYYEDKDRNVRKAAIEATAAWFAERTDRLDGIFDELVNIRTQIAAKLGHDSFTPLGYLRMTRNCYDQAMVERFRKGVRRYIVPIAARIKAEQAQRIGVSALKVYDDFFEYPEGNAKPSGTPDDIFAHGRKMYHELSPQTAEFIDFMLENELFDVLTRPGKSSGGYCTEFADYKAPFIFANFNGTSGDIDVLTHEAGHAFNAYMIRDRVPEPLRDYTSETAEVHSMGMEFFTWPWMEGFFADADKYRFSHLAGGLTFIPYGTMVDEFQHRVYEKPGMSPTERCELWRELEGIYRPWLDLSETPFFEEGRRWQYQMHIYERPFYYIDYCLAQTVALAFWAESQKDHARAWDKYMKYIDFSGRKSFTESLDACGLESPFTPDMMNTVATAAAKWLDGFNA